MTEKQKTETRTVAVAGFPYKAVEARPDGSERIVHKYALRGDTIELVDPADIARGDNNGHFVKPGESIPDVPAAKSLDEIGLMTDEELEALFRNDRPNVEDLLDVVGDDQELAARVLQVENDCGHDPRVSLVKKLEKLAEAGE